MSQHITTLILTAFATIFAFGFIYIVRKETSKMQDRKYKKLKGQKLFESQLKG